MVSNDGTAPSPASFSDNPQESFKYGTLIGLIPNSSTGIVDMFSGVSPFGQAPGEPTLTGAAN